MAKTLRVYNGDTKIAEGVVPLKVTQLTPSTTYNLKCAWFENGVESPKSDVPEFTTIATPTPPES